MGTLWYNQLNALITNKMTRQINRNSDYVFFFFFSSRRRHTRLQGDWSSDVCSSDLIFAQIAITPGDSNFSRIGRNFFLDEFVILVFAPLQTFPGNDQIGFLLRLLEIGRASCRERV